MRLRAHLSIGAASLRTRLAGKVSLLGGVFYASMIDLVQWLEPRIATSRNLTYRPRPWLGIVFMVLLALGLAQAGVLVVEAVQVVAHRLHREDAP